MPVEALSLSPLTSVTPSLTVQAQLPAAACATYVSTHPSASAYHDPEWLNVIGRTFGHQTRYVTAESDGALVGVLPLVQFSSRLFGRFVTSLPFVNYGGVLADTPGIERALVAAAIELTVQCGGAHLELRHTRQHFPELAAKRHKVAMVLGLEESVERQWAGLDRKVRNQVRKAEKNALTVVSGGIELLPEFHAVFARNMRDLGTPVYPKRFFREVLGAFPSRSRVFVIRHAGQAVAASLVHCHRDTVEVPWASALRESNPLCANVLLYWEMLRFAVERRFARFDFGRSTPNEGTFHFKKQWGAEPRELVWEYWTPAGGRVPDMSPKNPRFSLAIRAWQRLPVRVATMVGPLIVRNIP